METLANGPIELKLSATQPGAFSGIAINFNSPIPHPIYKSDIVRRGAFAKSLVKRGPGAVKLLWQHDSSLPLGKWTSIQENSVGLVVEGQLLMSLSKAQEAYALMKNGVIDSLSIGFAIPDPHAATVKNGERTLSAVDLWEISLVTFGADPDAKILQVNARGSQGTARPVTMADVIYSLRVARQLLHKWPPFPMGTRPRVTR